MGIGGVAQALKTLHHCEITASVMPHQGALMGLVRGVDYVEEGQRLNDAQVRSKFDIMLDFSGAIATSRTIREGEYYKLFGDHIGLSIRPAQFTLTYQPTLFEGRPMVAIHPGASNPNRRWPISRFEEVAKRLIVGGASILWLGTSDEYGFIHEHSHKASDESEALPIQLSMLSNCRYFIGNDSGFAHMAGMLGVPGHVLFSVTHPDDVIAQYPTLHGIHAFDATAGLVPTRSLRVDDLTGFKCMAAVTVAKVLDALPLPTGDGAIGDITPPERPLILVRGETSELEIQLGDHFDFKTYGDYIGPSDSPKGVIILEETHLLVTSTFRSARVAMGNVEEMRRAIREILLGN